MFKVLGMSGAGGTAPKRDRTSWFLVVTSLNGVADMHLTYKNSRGDIAPFSAAKQNSLVKPPWGTPVLCEYVVTKKGDDSVAEFKFNNKRR